MKLQYIIKEGAIRAPEEYPFLEKKYDLSLEFFKFLEEKYSDIFEPKYISKAESSAHSPNTGFFEPGFGFVKNSEDSEEKLYQEFIESLLTRSQE